VTAPAPPGAESLARVRALCESARADAAGGGRTDVEMVSPSEILALLDGPPAGRLPGPLRGDGPCQDCGTADNIVWFTDNPLWNEVVARTTPGAQWPTHDDPGAIVCIPCFVLRVHLAGINPVAWRLVPDWPWRRGHAEGGPT
jgi:hypothetical protein